LSPRHTSSVKKGTRRWPGYGKKRTFRDPPIGEKEVTFYFGLTEVARGGWEPRGREWFFKREEKAATLGGGEIKRDLLEKRERRQNHAKGH